MNPAMAQIVLLAYAALLAVGGYIGWMKARSRVSLIAGLASAVLASVFAWVVGVHPRLGALQGALLAVVLAVMFGVRFRKSRRWMPAGFMMGLSQAVALYLLLAAAFALQSP